MTHPRRARGRSAGPIALVAGALLAVGTPIAWIAGGSGQVPRADVGAGTATRLASAAAVTAGSPARRVMEQGGAAPSPAIERRTPSSQSKPAAPRPAVRTAPATSPAPTTDSAPKPGGEPITTAAPTVPQRIRIAALDLDAAVTPVGVDDRGTMAVPELVEQVGWYHFGPAPGAASGSVVLAGHVDSAAQGIGVFRGLWDAAAGDTVVLTTSTGADLTYTVVSRESFAKGAVPLADLFATTGPPRLTLITCGGAFDDSTLSYRENVVVTAVPA